LKIRFFSLKNNRIISIILIAILMMQIIMPPTSLVAYANSNCNVTFQNYDLSYCNEDINSAPLGTSLYHGEELVEKGVLEPDSLTEGYTYYLYGESDKNAYLNMYSALTKRYDPNSSPKNYKIKIH